MTAQAATAAYSRSHPSPRYQELSRQYAMMHDGSDGGGQSGDGTFRGFSLLPHASTIQALIRYCGARTVLDYGSGKGRQYTLVSIDQPDGKKFRNVPEFWGVDRVACFDPGVPEFSRMPDEDFDGVVSTDVLEHCPEEDLPWILREMTGKARRFVFATVALYPASKTLPNGENAHCTLRSPEWWRALIEDVTSDRPELTYRFELHWFYEGAKKPDGKPPEIIQREGRR